MFLNSLKVSACCIALLAIVSGVSTADEFHYNNFLIGDRAAGMAGAYTAVSDDPTGLYYNPAGIVYGTGRNLSASVNAYYNSKKEYDNVLAGNSWTRTSSSLLPNFFGITQPMGKLKYGFSYAVPDSISEDQDQVFYNIPSGGGLTITQYVLNFNNDDNTYQFGPSLAGEITNNLSMGATLYFHRRSSQMTLNQLIYLSDGSFQWENQYVELSEQGLRPIVGLMWSPAEKVTIGLAVSKVYVTSSDLRSQLTTKSASPVPTNTIDHSDISSTEKRDYPVEVRAGIAYFASSRLLLTVDGMYYNKVTDRVSVLNGAVGAEYYLDKNWAVRGGLFSDMANTPDLAAGKTNQLEKIDNYGISASISNFTRNTSITLGTSITTGSGKAQIITDDPAIQHASTFGWNLYLSSSYSY